MPARLQKPKRAPSAITAWVQMWEDDNDVCKLDGDSNVASFKRRETAYNPVPFSTNEVGNMANLDLWYNFGGQPSEFGAARSDSSSRTRRYRSTAGSTTCGYTTRRWTKNASSGSTTKAELLMRLPFDDPPGTGRSARQWFAPRSAAHPARAGVAGRGTGRHPSTEKDYLTAANGPANRIAKTMTVAAWIRPNVVNERLTIAIDRRHEEATTAGSCTRATRSACVWLGVSGVPTRRVPI